MRISDWSSDVCSSDLSAFSSSGQLVAAAYPAGAFARLNVIAPWFRSDAWRHQPRSAAARRAECCRHKPRSPSPAARQWAEAPPRRSEEHTSELQSLMRTSYAVLRLKQKTRHTIQP